MIKTTSLGLSKKMKELGFPQEPGFRYCGGHDWYENPDDDEGKFEECTNDALLGEDEYCESAGMTCEYFITAFTAEEVLDQLPGQLLINDVLYQLTIIKINGWTWGISYIAIDTNKTLQAEVKDELVQAAGRLWIWLKEQGLLKGKV